MSWLSDCPLWQHDSPARAPFSMARHGLRTSMLPFSRSLSTNPPTSSLSSGSVEAATARAATAQTKQSTTAAAAASATRTYRPSFIVLAPTFIFTHFTLAWALVPPIYIVLHSTNLSNTLLAGPQGAWFLSRRVPSWIPDSIVDPLVGGLPAKTSSSGASERPTVEELLERLARRGIRALWNISRSAKGIFSKGAGEEDALARAAIRELRGGMGIEKEEVKEEAHGLKKQISSFATGRAQGVVSELRFSQIRDALAAWVLVKMLFPVRLPISLLLTPRVARGLARFFAK